MIFNSPEFHALNGVEPTTYGCLTGVWKDGVFENGYSAPFAGFDIPDDTPPWRVQEMVGESVELAERMTATSAIRIKLPPPIYSPTWHAQVKVLLDLGFRVERAEINQHLDEFSVMNRKAMMKKKDYSGPALLRLCEGGDWDLAYSILLRNREERGRELKLGPEYVEKVLATFPDQVEMVTMDGLAAALIYHIGGIALVVYWGHIGDYRGTMDAFAAELMCQYWVLDLGISTDPGLMQFKRSVGAKEGLRLDMVRGL